MTRSRISLVIVFGLLILGITLFTFFKQDQAPASVFPAAVNNDCAPWDGAAFTVSVQYDSMTEIYISIWQAPAIKFPTTFLMAEDGEQDGYAYILPPLGPFIQLHGRVFFQGVDTKSPVQGSFDFMDENRNQFKGEFLAEWRNEIIYCG